MTNDRFTTIKENINEALTVEYRYWDDSDNAKDDMLWLLGEVARLRDNYAIFEELAPPDLPRDSFARLCYESFENTDVLYQRIARLAEALRNCMALAKEAMSYVDPYFRSKWNMDDEFYEIKKVLKEVLSHGHDDCLE